MDSFGFHILAKIVIIVLRITEDTCKYLWGYIWLHNLDAKCQVYHMWDDDKLETRCAHIGEDKNLILCLKMSEYYPSAFYKNNRKVMVLVKAPVSDLQIKEKLKDPSGL